MTGFDLASGAAGRAIEDIYPLTALQQGMLFHTRLAPGSGMYWGQNGLLLDGELDLDALRRAWELVLARHAVLRSTVVWDGVAEPLSVVSRSVPLPLQVLDFSGLDEAAQQQAVAGYLAADLARGADFSAPTLLRIALMRLGSGRHQLVWSCHHLLMDGWSVPIVLGQVLEAYHAFRAGEQPPDRVHRPFRDFVAWVAGQDLAEATGYWRQRLAGITAATSLGVERATGQHGESRHQVSLSAAVTVALGEFARRQRLTLNTVVQGAWAVLMAAYSGTDDLLFGVTTSGRGEQLDGMESMVGLLMSTTPARIRVDRSQPVAAWLRGLQDEQAQARRFEQTPLVQIQACSDVPSGQPLFTCLFVFENFPDEMLAAGSGGSGGADRNAGADRSASADGSADAASRDLQIGRNLARQQVNYPLTMLASVGRELAIVLYYHRARFDGRTIGRMAGHLMTLLAGVAADAEQPVSGLPLLTAAEREQLVVAWNDTAVAVPAVGGVGELIAARAAGCPDAVAVACGGQWLSYAGLEERAGRLANYLRELGVGPETIVGLCLERGADMIAAMLAVWLAGGAYLPLDPDYPAERLAFMLADSGAPVLVGRCGRIGDSAGGLADDLAVVWLDDPVVAAAVAAGQPGVPAVVEPGRLAYVIYTSGSTGVPKGVMVEHGSLVNYVAWFNRRFEIAGGDRVLVSSSPSFDAFGIELYPALVAGGLLVVVPSSGPVLDVDLLVETAVRGGVTLLSTVPTVLQLITGRAAVAGCAGLRQVVCGGEQLTGEVAAGLAGWLPVALHNVYGPTEATIDVSSYTHSGGAGVVGRLPIGRPIDNVRLYVLDRDLNLVPVGVAGELHIGGAGVARGYAGRPGVTAERFVADLFAADGSRVYRTGDRVRWRGDGLLEFLGRADEQVKVRGFRVEPGEVEAVLAAHPGVAVAVVVADGDGAGARLVAYLVPADPSVGIPAVGELREYLLERLPGFMVPSVFAVLAAVPLTPNGKLDRGALPAADAVAGPELAGFVPPSGVTQELLAGIWAEVLGADRVGAGDNFFELGGHSLLATRVISQVRSVFGAEVPLAALFDHPTVAGLAGVIEGQAAGAVAPPVVPVSRGQRLPLSFAQQRLWFLDQLEPGSAEHNVPMPVRLAAGLDAVALGRALAAIVARHEVLRTRLVAGPDGVPDQVIDPPSAFSLPVADVSGAADPLAAAEVLVGADAVAPFDLAAGPLIRGSLIRLGAGEHVLALSVHHVVFDEWSAGIFRRELAALYGPLSRGEPGPLPRLGVQYADFAVWQRAWLAGEVLAGQLGYWRGQLAGAPVLELPADRPRPAVRSSAGAAVEFMVPAQTAERLRGVARAGGATMFMTVLAGFAVLLGRYCGQDDVVVGTPVANRNRAEVEDLIGFFVNTLVLRADLGGDPGFGVLLGRVRAMALAGYAHQDLPFEQLVDALVSDRDRSRTPLFQVLFNYFTEQDRQADRGQADRGAADRGAAGGAAGPGSGAGGAARAGVLAKFDLRLVAAEDGGALACALEYSTALFDAATIGRMAGHLMTVLAEVAADPGQPVSGLPLLTGAEREQLVREWNDTAVPVPAGGVAELVVARAGVCPDAVAVMCGGAWLSYGGLVARAGRLAGFLRGAGVGPEVVVGLCLERGIEMVTAMLAVWLAGGAYLPLDPQYPAERLGFMLTDSRAAVVVGSAALVAELSAGRLRTVVLDDPVTRAAIGAGPAAVPVVAAAGGLAYVMYTSGSTGVPKGVLVTHGGVANLVVAQRAVFEVCPGDVVLQFAAFGFDASVWEVWATLAAGGTLAVASTAERAEPDRVAGLVRAGGVAMATLPPSVLDVLVPGDLGGVRTLVTAGERLDAALAGRWGGHHRLLNAYGPTEFTVCASVAVVAAGGGVPLIGGPVANARVFVLDAGLNLVPAGVAGELFIGGAQVARGYAGRAALTAERFVADPFAADGSRVYRTGDRVRWRSGGELEFLGRADDQVKVRGFRIEPGEVEAVLTAHRGVRSAVVAADGGGAARRLVAYLVPADPAAGLPTAAELRGFLGQRLPGFMVPSVFTELASLPLTPSGKIDRAALPAPDSAGPEQAGFVPPSTPAEELLAGIWAEILGVDRVGAGDNFFELGGHSLLATRVISQVRAVFGAEVPLAALFDQPTVAGLAALIEGQTTGDVAPPVTPADRGGQLPLSFAQQRLWFADQLEPGSADYNVPMPVRLGGALDVAALGGTLGAVVARHEVLRTRLVAGRDGVPCQVIDPPSPFPLPVADVSGAPDPAAAAEMLVGADAVASFDLAAGPLIRGCLIRLGRGEHVLGLSAHHVVFDEWSEGIFRRELAVLYGAFRRGEPDPLVPLGVQYADFAVWQRGWLAGEVLAGQLGYWREQLAGAPVLELPADRPRPPVRSAAGGLVRFAVPAQTAGRLRGVARAGGATMFMTLLAGFAVLLGRYCGSDDVVLGTPVANRNRAEVEDLIGFFVNTLVLRADLGGDPGFGVLLGRVRAMALAGYAHQDLPFEQLVDALVSDRDRSRTPLFQVLFRYATAEPGESDAAADPSGDGTAGENGTVDARASAADTQAALLPVKFDLSVALGEVAGGATLAGVIDYSTALFDAATVGRLAGHLVVLLAGVAADPGQPVSGLPLLTAAEREQLVVAWNDTAAPVPAVGGVAELITARAGVCPDAVAVTCGGAWLSYAGLLARAGRLAGYLRAAGAGPEVVVGLYLERGAEMVTAMLAVWLAGSAYLPLDPDYPAERLRFMLADSGAKVLVAQRPAAGGLADDLAGGLGCDLTVVWLDDPVAAAAVAAAGVAPALVPAVAEPGQLAYVIYTSGSTGRPKGVQLTHGGVVNLAVALRPVLRVAAGVRVLQFASFSFDAAVRDAVVALTAGGTLVVASSAERAEPGLLAGMIRGAGVQVASVAPSLLGGLDPGELAGVGTLVAGSERVSAQVVSAWAPGRRMFQAYGPTEVTVICCVGAVDAGSGLAPLIGGPVANTRVFVLDAGMNLVPAGVAGELFVGGAQLARGYAGRAGLTAERFIADPFAGDGSRLYRTGDRVRWRSGGELEFLGRADDQLKVRGFRIEPGEVEAVLAAHPGVRSAVVAADGDGADRRLVAYVVPADPGAGMPTAGELRAFLGQRLPGFMVPSVFTELASLPMTPSGKIDRAALPAPDSVVPGLAGFVPPSRPAEELLAGIWAEMLGLTQISVHSNFFELGGHSLLATRVISQVRSVFGVEVPLAALFDHPTVAGLAAVIEAEAAPPPPPVRPVSRDQRLPLSFAQQRLWFLDQLEPGSVEYNLPMPERLGGTLDVAALGAALGAVTGRHEVLRTRLLAGADGVPYQVIDPPSPFPLPVADVSSAPDPAAAAQALIGADAVAPFDLAAGPLIRACLIRLGAAGHVLALSAHHVVFDEWSGRVFWRELTVLYAALSRGEPGRLPPLGVQYADFAVWQRAWLSGEVLAGQLGYWRGQLAGAPVLELPADRPRPPVRSLAGGVVEFAVPGPVTERLRGVARAAGATMFMTVLAGFAVLLGRYCGSEDVVVGTPVANRNRAETEDLIGFFVNTLVLRADLGGDPGFGVLLGRVRAMALAAYAHQDLPFEQLVDALVSDRDRSRTPLFQVSFSYTAADPGRDPDAPGRAADRHGADSSVREAEALPDDGPTALLLVKLDLLVFMTEVDSGIAGAIQYSTALFDAATMQRMAGHLAVLLEAVAADPGQSLSGLPMLTAAERDQLLIRWNDTIMPLKSAGGVHDLIEAQAAARPHAVALDFDGRSLSYGALEARANRLAHYLRGAGAGTETIMGLCLERGVDMVVAMLAVWKVGGAYVPLDPGYPVERLAYMLADSRATVLLGTAAIVDELPAGRIRAVTLDDPQTMAAIWACSARGLATATHPNQLAYVVYTSGSTGRPKGISISHRDIAALVAAGDYITIEPDDVVAQTSSTSYDAAVFEIWGALANGAMLAGIDRDVLLAPQRLSAEIERRGITVLFLITALLNRMAAEAPQGLRVLQHLLFGGEAADPRSVQRVLELGRPRRLLHFYGPAEATTFATWQEVTGVAGGTVPIGHPVANMRAYVLDRVMAPVPVGVVGELYVGGIGVARGYLGRTALTAERFVPDPFVADGTRLYRTGDRVRWLPGGQLEFIGRVDDQVKVRGFRIEPGEIEVVLAGHPAVQAAVVVADGEDVQRRLVAYVVPASPDEGLPSDGELRGYLNERLPDFMIPAVFTELAALPLTANGKLDRAALPAPDGVRPQGAAGYVAPSTPAEELLAQVWAQALGLDRVGAEDNFFELGGHSLMATQVVAQIRASGYDISVGDFFDHPTIVAAAPLIRAQAADPEIQLAVRIRSGTSFPAVFCVHPLTGEITDYAGLAQYLGEGQQLYGLRSQGLTGDDPPLESVEEMAAVYLNDVRRIQPEGPYLLAGWSMGCYVALAMASQLAAMKMEVGGIFLIGPPLEPVPKGRKQPFDRDVRKLLRHVDDTINGGPGKQLLPQYEEQLLQYRSLADDVLAAVRAGDKQWLRAARVAFINRLAGRYYRGLMHRSLKPYGGRAVLFMPIDERAGGRSRILEQWRPVLRQEPEIVDVPGTHGTVIRQEGAQSIGAWLSAEITRWQRRG